jgi:hypothetical protein
MRRLFSLLALFATLATGLIPAVAAHAQRSETTPVFRAEGHPMRIDFLALTSKRADLRLKMAKVGVNTAFTEWLRTERPHAYREAVRRVARQQKRTGKACCATDAACCKPGAACCK